jgi:DNA-binding beta-propeller fold protein YncE
MTSKACACIALLLAALASAQSITTAPALPNMGQDLSPASQVMTLNPSLPDNPTWAATHAVSSVVSPLGDTLVVLTSGYNRVYNKPLPNVGTNPLLVAFDPVDSIEHVFIYDVSTATPTLKQVLPITNSYSGIVFDPTGEAFYVAGGPSDNVHIFTLGASTGLWGEASNSPLPLGHGALGGVGANVTPCAAGLAISTDSRTLVVANFSNDSITVFNRDSGAFTTHWSKGTELDLRPGKSDPAQTGVPGGEYPYWVAIKGTGLSATVYVSSIRDREIDVVSLYPVLKVTGRISVKGQPNRMTLNRAQSLLYVADDQADTVDVIDTTKNVVLESIPVIPLPTTLAANKYKGANPNSVTLSADEMQLFVTSGTLNCVSVIALGGTSSGDQVIGLIPTGWYPNSTSLSLDGSTMYVVNGKSPTGPNTSWCYGGYGPPGVKNCMPANQYNPQLTKAGLESFPVPSAAQLQTMTAQVIANDRLTYTESSADAATMAAVQKGIKHVIFILKENRTYDQILGDLPKVNGVPDGDSSLTEFGQSITPNEHNLARSFVTLDRFLTTAEVSVDGWLWSTSAQSPDMLEKEWPVAYAFRGLSDESAGSNRNVNVAIPTVAGRQKTNPLTPSDPDVLPGPTDVAAPDGPNNEINSGYLWNNALRAGLSVRSYGFFLDGSRYSSSTSPIPVSRNPFATGTVVAYSSNVALAPYTDPYFRGFDNALPDFYRYAEWSREFDANYASNGTLPALSLVRFMHDHTGNWVAGPGGNPPAAIDGVNTPELMVADNDYAVGMLVQKIANSMYANDTLIFVVEDDAQDGGDHYDSHRTVALVAGAYVKQGAVVSTPYNTINFVRTMEEVLGLPPMNLNDAVAVPMADIFNTTPSPWSFTAAPSAYLYNTQLMLPPKPSGMLVPKPTHNARYWARVTKGMDFSDADLVNPEQFNRILWKGLKGNQPYPAGLAGSELEPKKGRIDRDDPQPAPPSPAR